MLFPKALLTKNLSEELSRVFATTSDSKHGIF
jgi:hypothetical protein